MTIQGKKVSKYAYFWYIFARICLDGESVRASLTFEPPSPPKGVRVEMRTQTHHKGKPLEKPPKKYQKMRVGAFYAVGAGHRIYVSTTVCFFCYSLYISMPGNKDSILMRFLSFSHDFR